MSPDILLQINMDINSENNIATENHKHKIVNISVTFSFRQTYQTSTGWDPITHSPYLSGLFFSLIDLRGMKTLVSGNTLSSIFGKDKLELCDTPDLDKSTEWIGNP